MCETKSVGDHLDRKTVVKFDAAVKLLGMTIMVLVSGMYLDTVRLALCGNSNGTVIVESDERVRRYGCITLVS